MAGSENNGSSRQAILVAVDFEAAARNALMFAARLAADTGAPLTILHVVHEPADRPNYYQRHAGPEISLPMELLAERRLNKFLTSVQRLNPGLSALQTPGLLLVKGMPDTRIPEVARRLDAVQIVMGHTKPRGLLPNVFASLSDRVADNCDIPVTVIHADGKAEVVATPPQKPFDGDVVLGA